MINNNKVILIPLLFLAVLLIFLIVFIPYVVNGQVVDQNLENRYDFILDYKEEYNCYDTLDCNDKNLEVKYIYISDKNVNLETDERVFSPNTIKSDNTFKFFSDNQFIKIGDNWKMVETAWTPLSEWDRVTQEKLTITDIIKQNNPFKIYSLNAQGTTTSTFYAEAGDGVVRHHNSNDWQLSRGNSSGTDPRPSNSDGYVHCSLNAGNYDIRRVYLPFDTSALPDSDITIGTSSIFVYADSQVENDNSDVALIETWQNADNTLVAGDYSKLTLDSPPLMSDTIIPFPEFDDGYEEFPLNSNGILNISATSTSGFGIREYNQCIASSAPTALNYARVYFSEYTGTNRDPYIEVSWASTTPDPPAGGSTTTTSTLDLDIPYNNDLGHIVGITEHYESSSTTPDWVRYHYFHIPFLLWIIFAVPLLWVASRFIIEWLIRLRK